jgi:hypothetical protein
VAEGSSSSVPLSETFLKEASRGLLQSPVISLSTSSSPANLSPPLLSLSPPAKRALSAAAALLSPASENEGGHSPNNNSDQVQTGGTQPSPLAVLGGVEGVWRMVADFAGVLRGRELRNCREFSIVLKEILEQEKAGGGRKAASKRTEMCFEPDVAPKRAAKESSLSPTASFARGSSLDASLFRGVRGGSGSGLGEPTTNKSKSSSRGGVGFFACESGREFERARMSTGSVSSSSSVNSSASEGGTVHSPMLAAARLGQQQPSATTPTTSAGRQQLSPALDRSPGFASPTGLSGMMKGGSSSGLWDDDL